MDDLVLEIIKSCPALANFVLIVGSLRLICKPLFTFIDALVKFTPTEKDDAAWASLKESKSMKSVLWLIDYLASIKLPTSKQKQKDDDYPIGC